MFVVALLLLTGNMEDYSEIWIFHLMNLDLKIFMLQIFFDKNFQKPQECIDDNPKLPYCQVMGKFIIELEDFYSTITPYAHMNERCSSQGPDFFREEGC